MISLRLVLARQRLDLIHVDPMRRPIDAIGDRLEPAAGHVDRRTVGQVPACGEIEAHECVAGLHQREEHALIGLAAGIGLDVGEAAVEQLAGALDRELFRRCRRTGSRRNSAGPDTLRHIYWSSPSPAPRARRATRCFPRRSARCRRADGRARVRSRGRSPDRRRRGRGKERIRTRRRRGERRRSWRRNLP